MKRMTMKQNKNYVGLAYQNGYSLLELLVAMTIGVLVLASAVSMQVSNRDGFKATTTELNMKTNAKLAAEFIGTSLRGVGVMGCRTTEGYQGIGGQSESSYKIALRDTTLAYADFNPGHEVLGYQASGTSWIPVPSADLSLDNMLEGSDAITLRGGLGETYVLQDRVEGSDQYTLDIPVGTDVRIAKNNYAVASTCKDAEVFKVTSEDDAIDDGNIGREVGTNQDENLIGTWQKNHGISKAGYAELRRVATVTYYVGDSASGTPTLYQNVDGISSPLVEGVELMKLDYGIEDDSRLRNVASRYLSASQIQADCSSPLAVPMEDACLWKNVVSVRVSLIMRSKEPVYGKNVAKTYTLPGTDSVDLDVDDRFARTLHSSTFVIRNRMIGDRTNNG